MKVNKMRKEEMALNITVNGIKIAHVCSWNSRVWIRSRGFKSTHEGRSVFSFQGLVRSLQQSVSRSQIGS